MVKKTVKEVQNTEPSRESALPVTGSTVKWVERLYDAGAVVFQSDRTAVVEKDVRKLIHAMHVVLAGGDVRIDIIDPGGPVLGKLEELFDQALEDSNAARKAAGDDDKKFDPLTP